MELRQLYYFLAVAKELNFSRAAKSLQITQPPLSIQIQHLEEELGMPVFNRSNRQVELTPAGELFAKEVEQILTDLRLAVEKTQRVHRGEVGVLSIGFVGSATYDLLPMLLRDYRSRYEDVEVHLHEMSTPLQLEALHQRRIDIGFLRPPINDSHLDMLVADEGACRLAVPRSHPLAAQHSVSLSDLGPHPFVMLSRKTWAGLYEEVTSLINPKIAQEALEFQTVIGLVAAGLGVAVVPQAAINQHTQDVIYRKVDGLPNVTMGIAWRKQERSPLVNQFLAITRESSKIKLG